MESEETRPDRDLHDALEGEADDLERHGREVGERIEDVRGEWERKKQDDTVPGAQPADDEPPASGQSPADAPGGPA